MLPPEFLLLVNVLHGIQVWGSLFSRGQAFSGVKAITGGMQRVPRAVAQRTPAARLKLVQNPTENHKPE